MIEFDLVATSMKFVIVTYFKKGLKQSIKAKIDENATLLDDYKELVAKAVRAKIKVGLQSSFYIWETNQQVLRESQPTYTTAYQV